MKVFHRFFIFLPVLWMSFSSYANPVNTVDRTATFCKIWGFLKYYHPTVAKGHIDWDREFILRLKALDSVNSKEELSTFYIHWIDQLGKINNCEKCVSDSTGKLSYNLDLNWLNDSSLFTPELITRLKFIADNRNQGKNYYVRIFPAGHADFKHEKLYRDSIFPSRDMRLLSLARYWNIVNYFYPYKYKTDQNWNDVLIEMIPKFMYSTDTLSYHLAMMELVAKLNDSHAGFSSIYTNKHFAKKWVPFAFRIIDNKAIVTALYDDSLCKADDIQYGDVFLSVNHQKIEEIIREHSRYIGASNSSALLRKIYYMIFNGEESTVNVTFERNGVTHEKSIHRYIFKSIHIHEEKKEKVPFKILDDNIGYVNIALLYGKQVNSMTKNLQHTKAIIFDVRGYPNIRFRKICNFLNKERKPVVKFTGPDLSFPGMFQSLHTSYFGKNNADHYKGKVIVLFNEYSQSAAEFMIMALQTAPDVTCVGSQTSGADGNVSEVFFPGGYKTFMTGLGVFYPDGRETQRIGIVPDIEIKPTIEGIRARKDEVLEKAIEVAGTQK